MSQEGGTASTQWNATHTTTQMNLKCIVLTERSQIPKGYLLFDSIYSTLEKVELWKTDP